jgi:hypothetical protein
VNIADNLQRLSIVFVSVFCHVSAIAEKNLTPGRKKEGIEFWF